MAKFESREDLAAKVSWEGGSVYDALEYGIKSDEMPDDELKALWAEAERAHLEFQKAAAKIETLLEEYEE